MSVEEENYKIAYVSKRITKVTPLFAKLEWRIENFEKLMRLSKKGQMLSSEVFTYPYLESVKWKLVVYPNGIPDDKNPVHTGSIDKERYKCRPSFILIHEIELEKSESIIADCVVYALSGIGAKIPILYKEARQFTKDKKYYSMYLEKDKIDMVFHEDGSLLVICEVEFLAPEETYSMAPVPHPYILYPTLALLDNIKNMWKKQLCTDCDLQVGTENFPAHKFILSQWSEVFRSMFSHPTMEAKSGIVVISDFSSEAVSAMLEYMYTGEVKTIVMKKLHMELLALADKYALIFLKQTCEIFTASMIDRINVLQTAVVADRHFSPELKKACANHLAVNGREVLKSPMWKQLKTKNKNLANDLLELVIRDHSSFSDIECWKEDNAT